MGKINSLKETLEDEAENFDSVEIKFASAKGASPQLSDIPVITLLSFVYLTEGMAGDFTLREVKQFIGRRKKITKAPFKTSWVKSLGERVPPEWVYEVDYWPPDREYLGRKRDKVSEEVQAMPWSMRELFMWEPQYDAYVSKAQTIDAEE
ncbi:hypothetical protein N9A75_00080 [bacterium]|nr:hypothetical protein [bacterium]